MIAKEFYQENIFGPNDYYLVNFSYDSDSGLIFDFAVIYICNKDGKLFEVVRFDCSPRESFHIHRFFSSGGEEKRFIQKELSFETVEWCVSELKDKWFKYKIDFFEG